MSLKIFLKDGSRLRMPVYDMMLTAIPSFAVYVDGVHPSALEVAGLQPQDLYPSHARVQLTMYHQNVSGLLTPLSGTAHYNNQLSES